MGYSYEKCAISSLIVSSLSRELRAVLSNAMGTLCVIASWSVCTISSMKE